MTDQKNPSPESRAMGSSELGRAALEGFWSNDPEAAAANQWYAMPKSLKSMWTNAATAVLAAAHRAMDDAAKEAFAKALFCELENHDRCPPEARDATRRRKTVSLVMQRLAEAFPTARELGTRYMNTADGKIYVLVSEENDLVTFKREGRETLRYLSSTEFHNRFFTQDEMR